MKSLIRISIALLIVAIRCCWSEIHFEKVADLQLVQTYVLETKPYPERLDLSGLTTDGKHLFTVSDLSNQNDLFRIELTPKPRLVKVAHLNKSWLDQWQSKYSSKGRYDTEGIAFCDGKFYIAEETTRSVLELQIEKDLFTPRVITPNWVDFHSLKNSMSPFSGVSNAGLEAIACHPDKSSLFIFNERQFRMAYVLNISSGALNGQFTIPSGLKFPKLIEGSWVFPDFAGAHFFNSNLYLLIRNRQQIVKVDPLNYKVLKRWSYSDLARRIFKQRDVYGIAEGLTIYRGNFFIVLDHNLWEHSGTGKRNPVLLELATFEGEL